MDAAELSKLVLLEREHSFQNPWLAAQVLERQRSLLKDALEDATNAQERDLALRAGKVEELPGDTARSGSVWRSVLLLLPGHRLTAFSERLGLAVKEIVEAVGDDSLTAVLERRGPWVAQDNDYPRAASVIASLRQRFGGRDFDGGLQAGIDILPAVVSALFWLGRCSAELPPIHLAPPSSPWTGVICRYGVLHAELYDAALGARFLEAAHRSGFRETPRCFSPGADGEV